MWFSQTSFGIIISVTIAVIFEASATYGNNGLQCWDCSSKFDKKCGDYNFPTESSNSNQILGVNCSQIGSGPINVGWTFQRSVPATACSKTVIKVKGRPDIVTRGCASPSDVGILSLDAKSKSDKCKKVKIPEGYMETCTCKGDFCNGSGSIKLTMLFMVLSFGLFVASRNLDK